MKAVERVTHDADFCRQMTRHHAHSFYFAARFLPPETRRDVFALYAFYRTVDDLVDLRPASRPRSTVQEELNRWREWLHFRRGDPGPAALRAALAPVLDTRRIPCALFDDLLDGLTSDLHPRELATVAEMEQYCYQVAGTVGIVMSHVMGAIDASALDSARSLGIAMQLTNIVRDVGQDLERDMIYLPADDLRRYNYSPSRLRRRIVDADFTALMRDQIQRARSYYRRGLCGLALLPRDCRLPIMFAAQIYAGILTKTERSGYDVFQRRMGTGLPEKIWIAGKSYLDYRTRNGWQA